MGFLRRPLAGWERAVLLSGALALMLPGLATDGYGLLVLLVIFFRPGSDTRRL